MLLGRGTCVSWVGKAAQRALSDLQNQAGCGNNQDSVLCSVRNKEAWFLVPEEALRLVCYLGSDFGCYVKTQTVWDLCRRKKSDWIGERGQNLSWLTKNQPPASYCLILRTVTVLFGTVWTSVGDFLVCRIWKNKKHKTNKQNSEQTESHENEEVVSERESQGPGWCPGVLFRSPSDCCHYSLAWKLPWIPNVLHSARLHTSRGGYPLGGFMDEGAKDYQ